MLAELRQLAPAWARRPAAERARVLRKFQAALVDARDTISVTITQDTGKSRQDSIIETFVMLDVVSNACANAARWLKPEHTPRGLYFTKECWIEHQPYGVVAVISPWNYPVLLAIVPMVSALLAGNTVILKPSEVSAATGALIERLIQRVPELAPYVRVAHGDGAVGAAIVGARPDFIFLTGSTATGKKVACAAAEHLIPLACELGGKDPMIVLEDADLAAAAFWGAWGACFNAGQSCVGVERVYVAERVYDAFVAEVVRAAAEIKHGYSLAPDGPYHMGPITFPRQMDIIEEHMADALAKGARVLVGGQREGNFYPPTVLVDVTHDMLIMRDETFGPIIPIMKVKDEAEAIAMANDSAFGLTGYVWSGEVARARHVASELNVGMVLVNDTISHFGVPSLAIGGVKDSGFGRTHGRWGLLQFTQSRSVAMGQPPAAWEITTILRMPGHYNLASRLIGLLYGRRSDQILAPVAEAVHEQIEALRVAPRRVRQFALAAGVIGAISALAFALGLWSRKRGA